MLFVKQIPQQWSRMDVESLFQQTPGYQSINITTDQDECVRYAIVCYDSPESASNS